MKNKIGLVIFGLLVLAIIPFTVQDSFGIDYKKHVTAEDLGILQLAAHDLFNVNRCTDKLIPPCEVKEQEDGKLNLSTLFEDTTVLTKPSFDDLTIALGGEIRNQENIMLFTVASDLGQAYLDLREVYGPIVAREMVVELYHEKLAKAYQHAFGEEFPEIDYGSSSLGDLLQQNLALRTIHDYIPGKIKVDNKWISTLDINLQRMTLDEKELKQKSSKLDGKIDEEFIDATICFSPHPSSCVEVNLLEADISFGHQFNTPEKFEDFLEQLEDGLYDEDDSVLNHIRILMARGQNF
jgi:hypothetical protein